MKNEGMEIIKDLDELSIMGFFEVLKLLKDCLGFPEIVNFVFLFSISHLSIFINNISR